MEKIIVYILKPRNNIQCEILYIDNELEYSMYNLREKYLNYKPKSHQVQMEESKKIDNKLISNRFFNLYSLHMERSNDLQMLCKLRRIWLYIVMYIYIRDSYELENVGYGAK